MNIFLLKNWLIPLLIPFGLSLKILACSGYTCIRTKWNTRYPNYCLRYTQNSSAVLRKLENLVKSRNLIFYRKIREFLHFIKNSGKVREFENFNASSDFHAIFKIKLLNILSYIGTLNGLFFLLLSLKVKF